MILFKKGVVDVIKEVRLNKDSGLYQIVVNTLEGTRTMWIANVYLNKGTKKQIKTLLKNLEEIVPSNYLKNTFLIGDFNIDLNAESSEKDLILNLASSLGLKVYSPVSETRKTSVLGLYDCP